MESYYSVVMKSTRNLPFWGTGTLLCSSQPNLLLTGTVSSHLLWCNEQIAAGWTSSSPGVPSAGLLLSLLSQISEGFFLLLIFIYVPEVYVVWGLVWAAGCFSWKKPWWSERRMSSRCCFVEISLAGDRSVFLQGIKPAQQYQATWVFFQSVDSSS